MNPTWSPGQKIAYVVLCIVSTTLAMWAFGVWVVGPLQRWVGPYAYTFPEATFVICFGLVPIAWIAFYKVGRRRGWI